MNTVRDETNRRMSVEMRRNGALLFHRVVQKRKLGEVRNESIVFVQHISETSTKTWTATWVTGIVIITENYQNLLKNSKNNQKLTITLNS